MPHEVVTQLSFLREMHKSALVRLWKEHFQTDPSPDLRRDLMIRMLAYRMQEQAFGSLSQGTSRRLHQTARSLERDPDAALPPISAIKPGTRLVRRWKGRNHVVTIAERDYEYGGVHYSSLSEIARLITGTRWSGPLFFGLRHNPGSLGAEAP